MGLLRPVALLFAALVLIGGAASAAPEKRAPLAWKRAAPLPVARTEVAAAVLRGEIVVVGGYLANGSSTARVDAYSPKRNRWRRLPNLPVAVNHAMAAAATGRLYVVGGYDSRNTPLRDAFVFQNGSWGRLPQLPEGRAAGGAAVADNKLYVVGGRTPTLLGGTTLATDTFVLDLAARRSWVDVDSPTPREHLAVTAAQGKVYAVAGRRLGLDTNVATFEVYDAGADRWSKLPEVPEARGGTGATAIRGSIVSVGGEAPGGTIRSVYRYTVATRRWTRLPNLRTPRHGLGVVALNGRVYAVAGGPKPGLFVSGANEYLRLTS